MFSLLLAALTATAANASVQPQPIAKFSTQKTAKLFSPDISSITPYQVGPYVGFHCTLVSPVLVETQYYVTVTYYTDQYHIGTKTLEYCLFDFNPGWSAQTTYYQNPDTSLPPTYGVASYRVELVLE